nr:hypothetical protein [Flavobacterium sp. Leaf82]
MIFIVGKGAMKLIRVPCKIATAPRPGSPKGFVTGESQVTSFSRIP